MVVSNIHVATVDSKIFIPYDIYIADSDTTIDGIELQKGDMVRVTKPEEQMSMNLQCTINGAHIELWQTPSYITDMCLMTSKGVKPKVTGKQAIRAIRSYLEWCRDCNLAAWKTHQMTFSDALNGNGALVVYML